MKQNAKVDVYMTSVAPGFVMFNSPAVTLPRIYFDLLTYLTNMSVRVLKIPELKARLLNRLFFGNMFGF